MEEKQWEIIDKQKVWIGTAPDDIDYYKTEYIIQHTETGELRRI